MDEQRLQELAAAPVVEPPYDPSCVDCRRAAGKDAAGTTWQCVGHVYREREALRAEVRRLQQAVRDEATKADRWVTERDAAIAERDIAQESARALAVSVVRATTERDAAITERDAAQRRAQVAVDWVREIGDEIARLKAERDWRTVDTVRVSLAAVLAQEEPS